MAHTTTPPLAMVNQMVIDDGLGPVQFPLAMVNQMVIDDGTSAETPDNIAHFRLAMVNQMVIDDGLAYPAAAVVATSSSQWLIRW